MSVAKCSSFQNSSRSAKENPLRASVGHTRYGTGIRAEHKVTLPRPAAFCMLLFLPLLPLVTDRVLLIVICRLVWTSGCRSYSTIQVSSTLPQTYSFTYGSTRISDTNSQGFSMVGLEIINPDKVVA